MKTPFRQPEPIPGNTFDNDRVLNSFLTRKLPRTVFRQIEPALREMGRLSGGPLYEQQLAERQLEPVLTQWDPWGGRIDQITVTPLWERARRIAAEIGLVALPHASGRDRYSRIWQFALAYLFHPSTDVYTCPLAMTDGAVRTLLKSGNRKLIDRAVPRLTSLNPNTFWTSGQWMTESTGGSDVGRTETTAVRDPDGTWRLYGRKWFTSAVTSEMALALARPEGNPSGGKGLALFYIETRDENGRLAGIRVNRLKDKLGTRKLPTAELTLDGVPAVPVAGLSGGVAAIVPMLHITRTWNSVMSAATMRRGMALARDYAEKREAFGDLLIRHPLHCDTLAGLQAETEAAFHLSFALVELLGREETGDLSEDEVILFRILTSIAKLTTGKQAVTSASELLETFGGAGYVEDTGLPLLLRDSQVLPIWEGTTNVLSLDLVKAVAGKRGWTALRDRCDRLLDAAVDDRLRRAARTARQALDNGEEWLASAFDRNRPRAEAGARRFALTTGRAFALSLMVDHAQWALDHGHDPLPRAAACRFAATPIDQLAEMSTEDAELLAYDRRI